MTVTSIPNPYESLVGVAAEVDAAQQAETAEQQRYVNRLLNRGVIFTSAAWSW